MNLIIKNGRVIDPAYDIDEILDVLVSDGKIADMGKNIQVDADEMIDATGLIVCPGLIDMHVHLRDPGYEYKEDIISGTKAALMGGFTSVACMPNTNPVTDNKVTLSYIKNKAESAYVNVFPVGAITKGLKGGELAPIGTLAENGAVAISDDGNPVTNKNLLRNAFNYAKMFNIPIITHCEDLALVNDGVMNEGLTATGLGLRGNPNCAESIAIAADIMTAQSTGVLTDSTGTPIHIAHVSTRESVSIIRAAKKNGAKLTCETAPHYFSLTEKAIEGYNTNAKMNPPLRTDDDVAAIIDGLADGTIDVIATDHAPHHPEEKNTEFDKAPNGIIGLETSLAVGITYLVKTGKLSLNSLITKMSAAPSKILNLGRGTLSIGAPADITIFDENCKWTVDVNNFVSKSQNSPYHNFELTGRAKYTIVGGRITNVN